MCGAVDLSADNLDWFLVPAERGHLESQIVVGHFLMDAGDFGEARIWYERAAERGCISARLRLEELAEMADDLKRDYT